MKSFDDFDCHRGLNEESGEINLDPNCMKNVKESLFSELTSPELNQDTIFDHFRDNFYKPLALKAQRK